MSTVAVVERVPFAPPDIGAPEIAEVVATLESGWLSTGPRVRRFEEAFAEYIGAAHAVALNSCTAGLHLSLLACGAGPGNEVITTPLTFCSTANAIVHCGATPVFADVDARTGNLDPSAAEAAITPRTRALLPVHYAGRPVDVTGFRALAERYGLALIEDAAHCIEGVSGGRKIGTTADFTSFSFYATKNVTTGEGGMVTTASADAAERIRIASSHGLSRQAWSRYLQPGPVHYELVMPGFKYNMSDLQAAIGLHQLASIRERYERRLEICGMYDAALGDLPVRRFDPVPAGDVHGLHLYTIQIDAAGSLTRDEVSRRMAGAGVATSIHFPALHLHRYYAERFGFTRGRYPQAERISDTVLSLPLSSALSDDQITRVIDVTRGAFGA